MIRSIPLLVLLGLPFAGASAQSYSGLGAKIGLQTATFHSSTIHYNSVIGGTMGLYLPLNCGARFEIQPELLVSAQGAALTFDENGRRELRTYYVTLPLVAKVYVSNAINFQGGVQGGMLMMAQEDGEDVKDLYRPADAALVVGLGIDLMSGWDLTFRYTSGLTTTLVTDDHIYPKNRTLQFSAGYRFMRFAKGRGRTRRR